MRWSPGLSCSRSRLSPDLPTAAPRRSRWRRRIRLCRRSQAQLRKARYSPRARVPGRGHSRSRSRSSGGAAMTREPALDVGGATQATYTLKKTGVDNTIRVRVVARNADGSTTATSAQTGVVKAAAAPPPAGGCNGNAPLQIATISSPEHLVIDGQSINPSPVTGSTQSLTVRFHISCKGKAVQGALVYVDGRPLRTVHDPGRADDRRRRLGALTMNRAGCSRPPRASSSSSCSSGPARPVRTSSAASRPAGSCPSRSTSSGSQSVGGSPDPPRFHKLRRSSGAAPPPDRHRRGDGEQLKTEVRRGRRTRRQGLQHRARR